MKYSNYLIEVFINIVKDMKFGNLQIVHLGQIFILLMDYYITYIIILLWIIILPIFNDGLIKWITFDLIRFMVFLSFI